MIPYYGDFAEDATVYMPLNTFSSDDPTASVTATNLADADIKVHKDGGTTQIVTDGATVAIDFDGITGNHLVTIDTSAHADYSTGSDYMVRVEGVTVDAGTINAWIGTFSIENRYPSTQTDLLLTDTEAVLADTEAAVPVLTDTEAILADSEAIVSDTEAILTDTGTTLDTVVDSILVDTEAIVTDAEAILADTNELQTDWTNAGRLDAILDSVLVDTEAAVTDTEAIVTDTEAILVDTGTTLDTVVDSILVDTEAILADTNELQTDWTDAGRLDAILDSVLVDTEAILVDTGTTLLTDTEAILSDTEGLSAGSGLTPLASGTAQGGTASTIQLAAGETFADNEMNGNVVKVTTGTGAGQSRLITAYTGSTDTATVSPNWTTNPSTDSVYEIVEGAANLVAVGLTAQTAGDIIADTEAVLTDSEAIISDTEAILTDTGTTLDTVVDSILVDTEAIVSDTEAVLVDSEAIVADTNELQSDWVDGGRLDAILDARASQTTADAVETDTQDIQSRLPAALVGGRMDSDVEAINNNTAAADNLGASALGIVSGAFEGTPSTTVLQTDLAEATDDHYIGRVVIITSGDGANQATDITDYEGATGTLTVTALVTAPAALDTFVIV